METLRARRIRAERHAQRLATEAIRASGPTLKAVGDALGLNYSTIGHQVTDRPNRAVLDITLKLIAGTATDPLALLQAIEDAYELSDLILKDDGVLIEEFVAAMDEEALRDGLEDAAAVIGSLAHADAIDRHRLVARRTSLRIRELVYRGYDSHALYRERKAAA